MDAQRIASRLREIADHIEKNAEKDPFPSEEEMGKKFMGQLKKNFIDSFRRDPANKDRDPEKVWQALEKCISYNCKRILASA